MTTDLPTLKVEHPEKKHVFENQLNRISSQIALTNFHENEEAVEEFVDTIMDFKERQQYEFSFETWKSIGLDIANFQRHKENQIAQGVLEHFRQEIHETDPQDHEESILTDQSMPEIYKDVRYNCQECKTSWRTLEILEEFHNQVLWDLEGERWESIQETVVFNYHRTRHYPQDFDPFPVECPRCNRKVMDSDNQGQGDVQAVKINKDGEKPEFESELERLAPYGYHEVSRR